MDEDAQPAWAGPAGDGSAGAAAIAGSGEDDGPPLEVLEAQMGGEVAARDRQPSASGSRRSVRDEDEDDASRPGAVLPDLDTLTARLPADVRETLDELFRARFISVKKLPKKVFKSLSVKTSDESS